ncbi:MAG TPA: hypothetical protein VER17_05825 [Tepidisphaeraceae bacterium]|nr:hypothetical protein [Tepidisphaeraceae bacterium]
MELIRCHHCNAAFPDSMTACPRCGRDPDPPSRFRALFWILGTLGVIGMLVAMLVGR